MKDYIILVGLWMMYGMVHSLFAASRIKALFKSGTGKWYRYYRIVYSVFSTLLLIPVLWFQFAIPIKLLFERQVWTVFTGILMMTAGIMIMMVSFRQYDPGEFLGFRQIRNREKEQILQQEGVLGIIRHPLYSGSILALLGLIVFFPDLAILVMCMILILYFLVGILIEEKKLIAEFGEEYIDYRHRVPALIPSWKVLSGKRKTVSRNKKLKKK